MATLLLIIVYISFISLGLPDTLLGTAWPVMRTQFGATLDMAGVISFTVSVGTVISSLMSSKVIQKFGTGLTTFVSVSATALALLAYSFSNSFIWLIAAAIPLGLGGGAVDAALNDFIANHYKARHMNWLHCFWGVGAMTGPFIMSFWLARNSQWQMGYRTVAIVQISLAIILALSLPLWKKADKTAEKKDSAVEQKAIGNMTALKLPGVKIALIGFFCYCAAELSTGLWGSSYFVESKGISAERAAVFTSMFFGGITLGRFLSGFLTSKFNNKTLIRIGEALCLLGAVLIALPLHYYFAVAGLMLFGLGCAPIYPSMLHETPARFGAEYSRTVMGLQMAVAYIGSTIMPPILGFIAERTSIEIYPFFLIIVIILMVISTEKTNIFVKIKDVKSQNLKTE